MAADNVAVDTDNSTSPLLVVEDIHTSFMVPGG